MRDINPSHSCHKEASKWPATSNSEGQCSQSSTRKSRQKRPGLYKRNWPESKYAKLNGTVGRSVRTYMGWLRLHQVKARCQLTTTQQLHQIMKCKRFKVRKYTTAMMASTQLYSHRKNLRLWWGGEKFAKDPEEREKKKIRRPAMNDNGKWNQLDDDLKLAFILNSALQRSVERKVWTIVRNRICIRNWALWIKNAEECSFKTEQKTEGMGS